MKTAPTFTFKAAVVQGRAIKPAEVTDLAALPGKPELYARLLGTLQAPMTNLVRRAERSPARFDECPRRCREEAKFGETDGCLSNLKSNHKEKGENAMADVTQQQVVEYIKGISVLELSQLVKTLESELGVSAAAAMPMVAGAVARRGGGAAAPAEEKTDSPSR